jgi:tetratricopeptide (TPR) repeat protein
MTEDKSGAGGRDTPQANIAESLALGAEAAHGRLDPRAAAFLEKQSVLTDLQIEDLKREDRLRHWSLRVRHISDVLKLSFELALALIFTAIVFIIGAAIRSAADDNGVVIESFSVPPDLAAKGLTGDVIATKVLDRLSAMQAQTNSRRAASSYANNWGENIKVQIPDTGVSVGELNRFLHEWLGNQTHITGEIYRSANGIAITARAGSVASPSFTGSEDNLDKLIQQAAEAVYRTTQPYRYAIWLADHNRAAEAGAVLQNVARTGSIHERAWAYLGLGVQMQAQGDYAGSSAMMRQAIALEPDLLLAYDNLAGDEGSLQHDEQSVAIVREALADAERGGGHDLNPADVHVANLLDKLNLAFSLGDYIAARAFSRQVLSVPDLNSWENARLSDLDACGAMHDYACVRRGWAELPPPANPSVELNRNANLQGTYAVMGHWTESLAVAPTVTAELAKLGKLGAFFTVRSVDPTVAMADAELGDIRGAHATIDRTPLDCVTCLRVRGLIDALERRWSGAAYWYQRTVSAAPSPPFAYADWGAMLMMKGDVESAIAKFKEANSRAPHFADPLEMWGEALMQKNRSDLALEKFEEANRYAPNWGRLHLKWGEALFYAGRGDEARKQFVIASGLDLSQSDKSALHGWTTGKN